MASDWTLLRFSAAVKTFVVLVSVWQTVQARESESPRKSVQATDALCSVKAQL
jgi:hypothetical protein